MSILIVIILLQTFLMLWLFFCGNSASRKQQMIVLQSVNDDAIDVIITAKEKYEVIEQAILSFENLQINSIILALDHPDEKLLTQLTNLHTSHLIKTIINQDIPGKINTQKLGLQSASSKYVLIMDADIKVTMTQRDFCHMVNCFISSNSDFFCPYSFGIYSRSNIWAWISDCDRTMRQQIIRAGRDFYGISNLSGYFLLAKRDRYIQVIDSNYLQDDVVATINLFKNKLSIQTYHNVVCGELERNSFYKSLMQRIRWTAGNLLVYPKYIDIFRGIGFRKGIVFTLSSHFWYTSLYCDFIAYIFCWKNPFLLYCLIFEIIIKSIILSQRKKGIINFICHISYSIVWPIFSFLSLLGIIPFLIFKLEKESRR